MSSAANPALHLHLCLTWLTWVQVSKVMSGPLRASWKMCRVAAVPCPYIANSSFCPLVKMRLCCTHGLLTAAMVGTPLPATAFSVLPPKKNGTDTADRTLTIIGNSFPESFPAIEPLLPEHLLGRRSPLPCNLLHGHPLECCP